MKEAENDWDVQPEELPVNPAQAAQAAMATGSAPAPAVEQPEAQPQVSQVKPSQPEELPNDLGKALTLLREGEAELAKVPLNLRTLKNQSYVMLCAALDRVKQHFHRLQQDLPVVDITATDHAAYQSTRIAQLDREVLEAIGHTNYRIKALLDERDALAHQVEQLTKDLEAATAPKK